MYLVRLISRSAGVVIEGVEGWAARVWVVQTVVCSKGQLASEFSCLPGDDRIAHTNLGGGCGGGHFEDLD